MPDERILGPKRNNMENYGDLKPIAQNIQGKKTFPFASSLIFGLPHKGWSKFMVYGEILRSKHGLAYCTKVCKNS